MSFRFKKVTGILCKVQLDVNMLHLAAAFMQIRSITYHGVMIFDIERQCQEKEV